MHGSSLFDSDDEYQVIKLLKQHDAQTTKVYTSTRIPRGIPLRTLLIDEEDEYYTTHCSEIVPLQVNQLTNDEIEAMQITNETYEWTESGRFNLFPPLGTKEEV